MGLSNDLISQFIANTTKTEEKPTESTVYGTVVSQGSATYVQLDGSDVLTPVDSTSAIKDGDRVTVLIKNHTATVTGNITDPSASGTHVSTMGAKISEFEIVIADKVSTKELSAEKARIDVLVADTATIKDTLTATNIDVDTLKADNATIKNELTAAKANITKLEADIADIDAVSTKDLEATNAIIHGLSADFAEFQNATIDDLNVVDANIKKLEADVANIDAVSTEDLEAINANIGNLQADYGSFKNVITENINAANANITKLEADIADIDAVSTEDLEAINAKINNLDSVYIQTGGLEAYKVLAENILAINGEIDSLKSKYINSLKLETDSAIIQQLESVIAKIETLEVNVGEIETLVSKTIITEDISANEATIDNLTVNVGYIDQVLSNIVDTENLTAVEATIDGLNVQYANVIKMDVEELYSKSAVIEQLQAYLLTSEFGKFKILVVDELQANVADITSVLAGGIGTNTLQAIHLTADNAIIDEAVIKRINTDYATIGNDTIILKGSTQTFKDSEGNVRVQIGLDGSGDFSFIVTDKNKATIINADGITKDAVPDGLITDKMVSDDAGIQAQKVKIVNQNGTHTLQTYLEVEQGRINTLVKDTSIETESGSIKLKDAYSQTVQTVDGIVSTVGDIEYLNGQTIVTKLSTIEQTADKINLLVQSNDGESEILLTPEAIKLISEQIDLNGTVIFMNSVIGDGEVTGTTTINGEYIRTGSIKAEQIDTQSLFADTAFLQDLYSQKINADNIDSGKVKAEFIELQNLIIKRDEIVTLQIEDTGDITLRGSIESYNYEEGISGWSISRNGDAEFNDIRVRGDLITSMGGIKYVESETPQVLFWAGCSEEDRNNAPFIIRSDGSIKATTGEFGGVFSGEIQIGNISIVDPTMGGNDALLTIQNGINGVKRVQLTDDVRSIFSQEIVISDDFGEDKIILNQNGVGRFTDGITIGDENSNTSFNKTELNINGSRFVSDYDELVLYSSELHIGLDNYKSKLTVHGETVLTGETTLSGDVLIGTSIKITSNKNGMDIMFIGEE